MPLTVDALNPAILNVQYAVRGELAIKAEEYRVQLKTNTAHDLPFNKVISTNIGNPQQLGLDQPPITFNRQVRECASFLALAGLTCPLCASPTRF
jgi:alanine transaminase